jgi:dolichol-phosphate mannosyltransferase
MTLRVLQAGLKLTEVPITFVERERGTSKMSSAVIGEAVFRVAQWGIAARLHGRSAAAPRRKQLSPGDDPRYPLVKRCGARRGWLLRRWRGSPWRAVP